MTNYLPGLVSSSASFLRVISERKCLNCQIFVKEWGGERRWVGEPRSSPTLFQKFDAHQQSRLSTSSFQIFGAGRVDQWCFTLKLDAGTDFLNRRAFIYSAACTREVLIRRGNQPLTPNSGVFSDCLQYCSDVGVATIQRLSFFTYLEAVVLSTCFIQLPGQYLAFSWAPVVPNWQVSRPVVVSTVRLSCSGNRSLAGAQCPLLASPPDGPLDAELRTYGIPSRIRVTQATGRARYPRVGLSHESKRLFGHDPDCPL